MTAAETLRLARSYVQSGWCQGTSARDKNGYPCYSDGDVAVQWCMWGALDRSLGLNRRSGEDLVVGVFLRKAIGVDDVSSWNDRYGRTQREVLAAFDRAIELALVEETDPVAVPCLNFCAEVE